MPAIGLATLVLPTALIFSCRSRAPDAALLDEMDVVYADTEATRFEDAYERVRKVAEHEPLYGPAGVWYARLALRTGEYEVARNTLETLLRSHPENIDVLHLLALLEQRNGNIETSLVGFEAAIERLESHARVYLDRARLYVEMGLFREARQDINRMRSLTSKAVLNSQADELTLFMADEAEQ